MKIKAPKHCGTPMRRTYIRVDGQFRPWMWVCLECTEKKLREMFPGVE